MSYDRIKPSSGPERSGQNCYRHPMITLFAPPAPTGWECANVSPFCVKLEMWLRLAGLPYQLAPANPMRSPKGKIPYAQDGGEILADSGIIIETLRERHNVTLDDWCDPQQRAVGLCLTRTLEEHLYFCVLKLRWTSPVAWPHLLTAFGQFVPRLVLRPVMRSIRRSAIRTAHGQGIGRHSTEQILAMADADLAAASQLLGTHRFALGDRPSTPDATLFAFCDALLGVPWSGPENDLIKRYPNLVDYRERLRQTYWLEWRAAIPRDIPEAS